MWSRAAYKAAPDWPRAATAEQNADGPRPLALLLPPVRKRFKCLSLPRLTGQCDKPAHASAFKYKKGRRG